MKIAKWETFQGYQKTGPKWIKLHAGLIDKPEWMRLPLVAKAVLPLLWIAASRSGSTGELPDEPAMLSMLCHMKESEVLEALPSLIAAGFVECEGFVASPAKDLSQPVREECRPRERERERESTDREPVQSPPSSSVDSQAETAPRSDADADRSKLREALQDLRRRQHAFAEKTDQQILDTPAFHAPTGPVRLATCTNPALMRATAGKLRAAIKPRKAKAAKDSTDWAAAEAEEARAVEAWIRGPWSERGTAAPNTEAELRSDLAALNPPLHLAQAIEAALFEHYPAANADFAARVERMRTPAESRPAPKPPTLSVTVAPGRCPMCDGALTHSTEAGEKVLRCTDEQGLRCDWAAVITNPKQQPAA